VEVPRLAPRHLLIGLALMVGFAVVFALTALRADPASPVLAVARPVPAGVTITGADLAVVRVVPDPGMEVFTEAERDSVIGQTAAVPLAEGSLLSPTQVGAPDWPPAGWSVIAVTVPGGRLPAGLVAGSQVSVLHTGTQNGAAGGEGTPAPGDAAPDTPTANPTAADTPAADSQAANPPVAVAASVVEVATPDLSGTTVVSLLLSTIDAHRVAAAADELAVVLESPARGR
jgi:hypothetical protein